MEALLALDPHDTVNAGIYGNKPGYHNSRTGLLNAGLTKDYSIQLVDDKAGPSNQGAACDWTFRSAQGGDFSNIATYGGRVAEAFRRRDIRLKGWREVLIQADLDRPPEGFDFVGWFTRTPDDTHSFHGHFSILRRYIQHWPTYEGMLDILAGKGHTDMLGLEKGDTGAEVRYLQTLLKVCGFYKGTVDGVYGTSTSAAVLAARKSVGSDATSGDRITDDACEQVNRAHIIRYGSGPGPRGPAGPAGPAGPVGPPGPKGDDGIGAGDSVVITGTVTGT